MHQTQRRFALAGSILALVLAINVCATGVVGATPMTGPSASASSRPIGQQAHQKTAGTSPGRGTTTGSASPNITYVCDIYDLSTVNRQTIYLQTAVSCPVPATITQDVYLDYCTYWNWAQSYCQGVNGQTWVRQGGGIHCSKSGVTYTKCPATTPLPVTEKTGNAYQTDVVVTTTIPGTEPPTVTGEYYGQIFAID